MGERIGLPDRRMEKKLNEGEKRKAEKKKERKGNERQGCTHKYAHTHAPNPQRRRTETNTRAGSRKQTYIQATRCLYGRGDVVGCLRLSVCVHMHLFLEERMCSTAHACSDLQRRKRAVYACVCDCGVVIQALLENGDVREKREDKERKSHGGIQMRAPIEGEGGDSLRYIHTHCAQDPGPSRHCHRHLPRVMSGKTCI